MSWIIFNVLFTDVNPIFLAQLDSRFGIPTENVQQPSNCPAPILSRLGQYRVTQGDSIDTIASKHNLLKETLIRFNPILQKGLPSIGTMLLIPPVNGISIQAPNGATWQDLEAAYGVRKDVLFELNGCQKNPSVVFIPGTNWDKKNKIAISYLGLPVYPLNSMAPVGLGYGWQNNPKNGHNMFHSGIDLLAPLGTPIFAADKGIVVFAGKQDNYGNLVVINHGDNFQTRYAHLASVKVIPGQQVGAGTIIGTIGNTGEPDITESHLHFEVRYHTPQGWLAQEPQIHLPQQK